MENLQSHRWLLSSSPPHLLVMSDQAIVKAAENISGALLRLKSADLSRRHDQNISRELHALKGELIHARSLPQGQRPFIEDTLQQVSFMEQEIDGVRIIPVESELL